MNLIRRIIFVAGFAFMVLDSFAQKEDGQGHLLVQEWKKYELAVKADLPKDAMAALEDIVEKAQKDRYAWDFYDAWQNKVRVGRQLNWKNGTALENEKAEAFKAFDEPIIKFLASQSYTLEELRAQKQVLVGKVNRGFYSNVQFQENDYEFLLWRLFTGTSYKDAQAKAIVSECREVFGPVMDLDAVQRDIIEAFNTLNETDATQEQYKALRARSVDFEKQRSKFYGKAGAVAESFSQVKDLLSDLDEKNLTLTLEDGQIVVRFKNLTSATLTVESEKGKMVYKQAISNPNPVYYLESRLEMPMPKIDDGNYCLKVKNGNADSSEHFEKNSISAYLSQDADGMKLYAASFDSGLPLSSYDIKLYGGEHELVARAEAIRQGAALVLVPSCITSKIKKNKDMYLVLENRDKDGLLCTSSKIYLYSFNSSQRGGDTRQDLNAVIMKDCAAFHRGDVVKFKTVAYRGHYYDEMAVAESNLALTARFIDPSGAQIAKKELATGENGSADSYFDIPLGIKGGRSRIEIEANGHILASTYLTVDDFVLPDYDCEFDKIETLCFSGDKVRLSGCLKSYSGHPLDMTSAYFTISGSEVKNAFKVGLDGRFSFDVQMPGRYGWGVEVTVVVQSSTGETLQFSKSIPLTHSLDLECVLRDRRDADVNIGARHYRRLYSASELISVLEQSKAVFDLSVKNYEGLMQKVKVDYVLEKEGATLKLGSVYTPSALQLELPDESGEYKLTFCACVTDDKGEKHERRIEHNIIRLTRGAQSLDADVENLFIPSDNGAVSFIMGATKGAVHALMMVYSDKGKVLDNRSIDLTGKRSGKGSLVEVNLPFRPDYTDAVMVRVIYFREGKFYCWEHNYTRSLAEDSLVMSWQRFVQEGAPGAEYTINFNVPGAVEALVSIFDKSTESIDPNLWSTVSRPIYMPSLPDFTQVTGGVKTYYFDLYAPRKLTYGAMADNSMATASLKSEMVTQESNVQADDMAAISDESQEEMQEWPRERKDFATTIAWAPMLAPAPDGSFSMKFRTSDKLSTFIVQVFAHDEKMRNVVERREMMVSLPVQVSMAEAKMLREGDHYVLKAVVSSTKDDASGKLRLKAVGIGEWTVPVSVPASQSVTVEFPLDVKAGITELPLYLSFMDEASRFSDAISVTVPVAPNRQRLTEAHSAVLLPGADKQALADSLRREFVNISSYGAEYKEVSIKEMLEDVLKNHKAAEKGSTLNSLALSEQICVNALLDKICGGKEGGEANKTLIGEFAKFINDDGGFAWFEQMNSSQAVTAAILERFALCDCNVLTDSQLEAAVKYLDKDISDFVRGGCKYYWWRGGINLGQYLYVRSFYPQIAFSGSRSFAFKCAIKKYLAPKKIRGLSGDIYQKSHRLSALRNLVGSEAGMALLRSFGARVSCKKLMASLQADVASLSQYAQAHGSGGIYYPNLVMPWRSLLASEAYCHGCLAMLLQDYHPQISDGIRIWLMLQKETQHWESSFAFVNTVAAIYAGSPEVLETKVIYMSRTFEKEYSEIKAAGNGFRISREFELTSSDGSTHILSEGEALRTGDKIRARYKIWNEENRSFVRVKIPRHACLSPVSQLSGLYGWRSSQNYREVFADRSEYYFDSYPEENTEIVEEFFVSQKGVFTCPVVEIESLYAPEYRANGAFEGSIVAE